MKSETDIMREICEHLAEHHYFFWRNNNIPVIGRGPGGFRSLPKWTPKGLPDIFIVHKGQLIGVEVKRPVGSDDEREPNGRRVRAGAVSPDQANFGYRLVANGARYIVTNSLENLLRHL